MAAPSSTWDRSPGPVRGVHVRERGTFGYHCGVPQHGHDGTVQVDATGADSLVVQIGASGFNFTPSTAHIKPTGYVRWVNASGLSNHTVTSDS